MSCPDPAREATSLHNPDVPTPQAYLIALFDRMIGLSAPPAARAIDYSTLLDDYQKPLHQTPSVPPGVLAREQFHAFVEVCLAVREELGIEAEQAWLAVRYEARPIGNVAGQMGLSAREVGELVLLWEYHILARL